MIVRLGEFQFPDSAARLYPDTPERPWVLAECYGADRARIRAVIEGLLAAKQIAVEAPDTVRKALRAWGESSADFADALIGAVAATHGAARTVTFDRAAAKLPGFELL